MRKCLIIALSVVVVVALIPRGQGSAAERPNIILVMADDQGWGDMAYNGHPNIKTPNFDSAAATGLRFDRFYAAAPVCSPTRASVMTGRHPNRMGVFKWGYPMRPQETTIAEALKTVGYTTAHFGKWHLGSVRNDSPANPGRNGFDEWLSAPNFYDNDAIMSRQGKAVQTKGESSMIAVDAALDWMTENTKSDDPFLAVVWFGSPHSPHVAAEEDRKLYAEHPKNFQNFYGEVTGMDRAFGKLRNSLDGLGIRDNTILWYCSDNGGLPKVGSTGGRANKGKVYDGGLLVPAILEWPARIAKPRTTDIRCNTCDIYPTLLEITGVSIEGQAPLDGVSLASLIDGKDTEPNRTMGFWDYTAKGISTPSASWMADLFKAQQAGSDLAPHESSQKAAVLPSPAYSTSSFPGHSAWIDGDWKLHRIQGNNDKVKWELYNLATDATEADDVSEAESKRVAAMRGNLDKWLVSVVNSLNGKDYVDQ
ncbi:MAG: sulfatase-like hydrolase/transferase [Planctomycetes bacterium]|nr:sulfatase-like hydrolase/transferase [Planctomycetota bacterium]